MMIKIKHALIAASLFCLSSNSFASDSLPDILKQVNQQDLKLLDSSAQAKLRGEYISGNRPSGGSSIFANAQNDATNQLILFVKQSSFCAPAYILCKGSERISSWERRIVFSFRSTPNKIEYKRY